MARRVSAPSRLVGAAERHPVAVIAEHHVQVVERAQVVAQLRLADLDDQRRRLERLVAPGFVGWARDPEAELERPPLSKFDRQPPPSLTERKARAGLGARE
jgi:hypothetical protein